jgi:glucan phosphoethanolaminetransferase (alkaline phosphatase superfamily)
MASNQATTFAFIVSLIGGLIIAVISIINVLWFSSGAGSFGGYGTYMHSMMDSYHNFMGSYATSTSFFTGLSLIAVICGVIIIMAAILLQVQPHQHNIWAAVIIVASIVSFVGMGGYFIGAVLGIVGGAFQLAIKPNRTIAA